MIMTQDILYPGLNTTIRDTAISFASAADLKVSRAQYRR